MQSFRPPASWSAVLEGEWRARAIATAREIADVLVDPPPSDLIANKSPDDAAVEEASIARGRAGLAILFTEMFRETGEERYRDAAFEHLDRAIATLGSVEMGAGLFTGFTGVAYAANHLAGLEHGASDPLAPDSNDDLDELLAEHVTRSPWTAHYDLISGLAGFGVYALARAPRPAALTCASRCLDRLEEMATRTSAGVAWFTHPDVLPEGTRKDYADGYYNLGAAHGASGVIGFLAGCVSAGVETPRARELAASGARWMLAQELAPGASCRFPYFVGPSIAPEHTRLAWCYGDIGVATTLLTAARHLGSTDLERHALRIARAGTTRREDAGVVDACLCHGSAGLGHLFNRIYQATGDTSCRDVARTWYREAIESREPGTGIAGYVTWKGGVSPEGGWIVHPGLLDGVAGTALALIAGASDTEPTWDALLLIATPSR